MWKTRQHLRVDYIEKSKEFDGKNVVIKAEAIDEPLERGYVKEQPINKERRDIDFILMISTILLVSIFYRKLKI